MVDIKQLNWGSCHEVPVVHDIVSDETVVPQDSTPAIYPDPGDGTALVKNTAQLQKGGLHQPAGFRRLCQRRNCTEERKKRNFKKLI